MIDPSFTLFEIWSALAETMPDLEISFSSIDRLLRRWPRLFPEVGHAQTGRETARKSSRSDGSMQVCRMAAKRWYDGFNFNVWCTRSFARAKRGAPAVELVTGTRRASMNILLCMSVNGIVHWNIAYKVHWAGFNEFLEEASQQAHEQDPDGKAVFIFDNAPANRRGEVAALAVSQHTIQRVPPYSPFFNPTEELFSKFKFNVKAYLEEHRQTLLNAPAGMTKKTPGLHTCERRERGHGEHQSR